MIHYQLPLPGPGQLSTPDENKLLQLCKFSSLPSTSHQILVITHEVCVREELKWTILIHGNELHQIANTPLSNIPLILGPPLNKLITTLDEASVCPGNPDEQYAPMVAARKGVFLSANGEEKVRLEKDFPVMLNGDVYHQTIRTSSRIVW